MASDIKKWAGANGPKKEKPPKPAPYNDATKHAIAATKSVMKLDGGMFRTAHQAERIEGHEKAAQAHREAATANAGNPTMVENHTKTAEHHDKLKDAIKREGSFSGDQLARDENGRFAVK